MVETWVVAGVALTTAWNAWAAEPDPQVGVRRANGGMEMPAAHFLRPVVQPGMHRWQAGEDPSTMQRGPTGPQAPVGADPAMHLNGGPFGEPVDPMHG